MMLKILGAVPYRRMSENALGCSGWNDGCCDGASHEELGASHGLDWQCRATSASRGSCAVALSRRIVVHQLSVQNPLALACLLLQRTAAHRGAPRRAAARRGAPRRAPQRTAAHRSAPHRTAAHRGAPQRTAAQRSARSAPRTAASQRIGAQRIPAAPRRRSARRFPARIAHALQKIYHFAYFWGPGKTFFNWRLVLLPICFVELQVVVTAIMILGSRWRRASASCEFLPWFRGKGGVSISFGLRNIRGLDDDGDSSFLYYVIMDLPSCILDVGLKLHAPRGCSRFEIVVFSTLTL